MKRVVLCLGLFAACCGVPLFLGGCTAGGGYIDIRIERECPLCHHRHGPGPCPDHYRNDPPYRPPHYVPPHRPEHRDRDHREHHGHR